MSRTGACTPVSRITAIYFPGFFSDANHVRSLVNRRVVRKSIWIGNRTCIAAHFDNSENLACVVGPGRPPLHCFFPPDQIRNL